MANLRTLNRMFPSKSYTGCSSSRAITASPLMRSLRASQYFWRRAVALLMAIAIGIASYVSAPQALYATGIVEGIAPVQSLAESTDIPSEKIDHFAQAYLQVLKLLSDREPELPAAETSAEAQKIQQSIEAEAIKIIERNELSLPEYMNILSLASQDEAFQDKVLGRMDESLEEVSQS